MKVRCGCCKKFVDRDTAFKCRVSYYCDRTCYKKKVFEKKVSSSKTSPVKKLQPLNVSNDVRAHVLARDGFKCRYCQNTSNLVLHHVVYRSEARNRQWCDEVSNLITLCNYPCHIDIVHGDKRRWQPLCLGIIWLREVCGDKTMTLRKLERKLHNGS